ncbi:unnamed protein product [Amoebophrya sp. A25]|nr:unnamed protein product [Amoebophrya sp. A25]|eukprot:GSA25T00024119001.1
MLHCEVAGRGYRMGVPFSFFRRRVAMLDKKKGGKQEAAASSSDLAADGTTRGRRRADVLAEGPKNIQQQIQEQGSRKATSQTPSRSSKAQDIDENPFRFPKSLRFLRIIFGDGHFEEPSWSGHTAVDVVNAILSVYPGLQCVELQFSVASREKSMDLTELPFVQLTEEFARRLPKVYVLPLETRTNSQYEYLRAALRQEDFAVSFTEPRFERCRAQNQNWATLVERTTLVESTP